MNDTLLKADKLAREMGLRVIEVGHRETDDDGVLSEWGTVYWVLSDWTKRGSASPLVNVEPPRADFDTAAEAYDFLVELRQEAPTGVHV